MFVLNASLPYHMLAACAEALPRPNWELALYIIISGVMRYRVLLLIQSPRAVGGGAQQTPQLCINGNS